LGVYGFVVDSKQIDKVSNVIRHVPITPNSFLDPNYYPDVNVDAEYVARYFLVMVAMDHRLSRPRKPYEALIDGVKYHGADLLYKLGMLRFNEDPEFYSPKRLSNIKVEDVIAWLSVGDVKPPDPQVRTLILRDLGFKLLKLYNGNVLKLLKSSKGLLKGLGEGFIDRLKVFIAYQDPVEKKPYLLVKFLERRGLLKVKDIENLEVPVDNHLSRIALRLGIVRVSKTLLEKIKGRKEFSWWEDVMLRLTIRQSYKILSSKTKINPLILDDVLWSLGRKYCTIDEPKCDNCIFKSVCIAHENPYYMMPEHNYFNTWYY